MKPTPNISRIRIRNKIKAQLPKPGTPIKIASFFDLRFNSLKPGPAFKSLNKPCEHKENSNHNEEKEKEREVERSGNTTAYTTASAKSHCYTPLQDTLMLV